MKSLLLILGGVLFLGLAVFALILLVVLPRMRRPGLSVEPCPMCEGLGVIQREPSAIMNHCDGDRVVNVDLLGTAR